MNKQTLRNVIICGLFVIPFIPFLVSSSFFFPFITTKAFAFRVIVELVFAAWVILALSDRAYRPKKSKLLYALGAFLVTIGLSNLFGVDRTASFWSNFERMEGYVALLHFGAFFLVISSVFNEENWKRWWNTSLAASGIMVGYAILQLLGALTIHQGGVRVDGTFGNAIYLAVYMLVHIFIALLLMVQNWRNKGLRWVYGSLIVLQTGILYYTATRGAILGLLGGLVIFALLNIRNKENHFVRKVAIAVVSGIVILTSTFFLARNTEFVNSNAVLSRFSSLDFQEIKSQGRYFVWPMAVEGVKDKPILGWGQENFIYVFQEHYRPEMYTLEPWFDRAHNIFLDWAVAGGLVGLTLFLSLYVITLYLIWKKDNPFIYVEKTVLTALLAAYFFHNFFVFDHQTSYILFFSLLAYIQFRTSSSTASERPVASTNQLPIFAVSLAVILIGLTLYYVNYKPFKTNTYIIEAFKQLQTSETMAGAPDSFELAYRSSTLGKTEVVEQMSNNAVTILSENGIPLEKRNEFYQFLKDAVSGEGAEPSNNARRELIYGSLLSSLNLLDESLVHLERARELMPTKQQIHFEIGAVYINKKDYAKAQEAFQTAYELAPGYEEAQIIRLVGAIYANDRVLETQMINELGERQINLDNRIFSAYYSSGRLDRARNILEARKQLDPENATVYEQYLQSIGN